MKYIKMIILFTVLIYACSDNSTNPGKIIPSISFSPESVQINSEQITQFKIKIDVSKYAVFAVSLRICYNSGTDINSDILSFDEAIGFSAGDFFGDNAVVFVKADTNIIYLSISLTKGQELEQSSGELGTITFTGQTPGIGNIEIDPVEFYLYDSDGGVVTIPDFKIKSAVIEVK